MTISTAIHEALQRAWQRKGWLSAVLLPLSTLAARSVTRKQAKYRAHPELAYRPDVPVVVVGNIYVGGTGKTPVVIALVNALREAGWMPGVVSRGYGVRLGREARVGKGQLTAAQFGDEPAHIAAATQVPVAVHPDRPRAVRALQAAYPDIDVLVSDDGLQHLALARDIEIVVQDGRGIGNGRMLPAGPLREPRQRLRRADILITNLAPGEQSPPALATRGKQVSMSLRPHAMEHLESGKRLPWPEWMHIHGQMSAAAVAAIGRPQRFFAMLRDAGLAPSPAVALPDHHAYDARSPFSAIDASVILITGKDAVKCRHFHDDRLWVVHAQPHFSDPQWVQDLIRRLRVLAAKAARH